MRVSSTEVLHWIGGYDLAGIGAITEIDDKLMAIGADATSHTDKFQSTAPTGQLMYTLTEKGWYDKTARSMRNFLIASEPVDGWDSLYANFGKKTGFPVTMASGMRIGSKPIDQTPEKFAEAMVEYLHQGEVWEGRIIAPGTRVAAPEDHPFDGYRLNYGAAQTGKRAIVMVQVNDPVWHGAETLKVQVLTAPNLNALASWTVRHEFAITPATVPFSATSIPIDDPPRHLALRWVWEGASITGSPSAKLMAGAALYTP